MNSYTWHGIPVTIENVDPIDNRIYVKTYEEGETFCLYPDQLERDDINEWLGSPPEYKEADEVANKFNFDDIKPIEF